MKKFRVKENICCLGKTWGGYFTGLIDDYAWAKTQMERNFMDHLHKYKDCNPKVSMGRTSCKLTMDNGDFVEVIIEEFSGGDVYEKCSKHTKTGN